MTNIEAFLLPVGFIILCGALGYPIAYALLRRNLIRLALLAPTIGLAMIVLVCTNLNRLGVPLRYGGPVTTISLGVLATIVAWRYRPRVVWRALLPFFIVMASAELLIAWPLLQFGFNWISFGNDDAVNYVLTASHFLNHGNYQLPSVSEFLANSDPSWQVSFFYSLAEVRASSQYALTWLVSVAGLTPAQAYMPFMCGLHLILAAGAGALVCTKSRLRFTALLTVLLVITSAMVALGTLYELAPQLYGIIMLMGSCTLLLLSPGQNARLSQQGLLAGIVFAALLIGYPEAFPFIVGVTLLYFGIHCLRERAALRNIGRFIVPFALVTLASANSMIYPSLELLKHQLFATGGFSALQFPYYLMPSGLSLLWGFSVIGGIAQSSAWFQISIALGGLLLLLTAILSVRQTVRGQPAAMVTLMMLLLAAVLFYGRGGFGLFKLAMYIQPFLLATLTLSIAPTLSKRTGFSATAMVVLAGFIAINLFSQFLYVDRSRGLRGTAVLVELPEATPLGFVARLIDLQRHSRRPERIVSDASNYVLAKYESDYSSPNQLLSASGDFWAEFRRYLLAPNFNSPTRYSISLVNPRFTEQALHLLKAYDRLFSIDRFRLQPGLANSRIGTILHDERLDQIGKDGIYTTLLTSSTDGAINARERDTDSLGAPGHALFERPWTKVRNHLVLVSSDVGGYRSLTGRIEDSTYFRAEKDYFYPSEYINAVGRYLIFRVVNPDRQVRLAIDYTSSLNGDGSNSIPPIAVVGATRESLPALGRGSARMISPPIAPQYIQGAPYIAVDMGRSGRRFPSRRVGLMRLYGADLPLDFRQVVGFVRNISLIDVADFAGRKAPSAIASFPAGLASSQVEYSGLYEDGWSSERAWVRLNEPRDAKRLVIRGTLVAIPLAPLQNRVSVLIDGRPAVNRTLTRGLFEVAIPVDRPSRTRTIELIYQWATKLPNDGRPVSAQLSYIGFAR